MLQIGPTTVNVRVTGLTPGPHGFHLVSTCGFKFCIPEFWHILNFPKIYEAFGHLFILMQHEYGDTTNGCISTGTV